LGGGWNKSGNSSERLSIQRNMERLAAAKARVDALRTARVEASSLISIGRDATVEGSARMTISAQERQAVNAYEILRDIVGRQKTIKALYRTPKPAFVSAEAEIAALKQRLAALER
jgi:hypothetical protein